MPVPFSLDAVKAQAPDPLLLKAIYKELEFHSLLKELGPAEDARPRDYRAITGPDELKAWLAEAPERAPVAVAISKCGEGEFVLDLNTATVGLSWRPGEARAVAAENLPHLKLWLEDARAPKIACDVKSALLELSRLGARQLAHLVQCRMPTPPAARWRRRRSAAWI